MAKKFSFSLQRLLDFKVQLFDVERTILAEMNALLQQMNQELEDLYREHREKTQELREESARGMTSLQWMNHKNYLRLVEELIQEKLRQIELQVEAIERQTDKVREAKIEISSIEKLKEKKWEEYVYKENKAEEQFIEEFVSNTRAVAGGS